MSDKIIDEARESGRGITDEEMWANVDVMLFLRMTVEEAPGVIFTNRKRLALAKRLQREVAEAVAKREGEIAAEINRVHGCDDGGHVCPVCGLIEDLLDVQYETCDYCDHCHEINETCGKCGRPHYRAQVRAKRQDLERQTSGDLILANADTTLFITKGCRAMELKG